MNEKVYWCKRGKHQEVHDKLHAKLVPDSGRAFTMHGNLLRCMDNLYYDLYNNGLGNAGPRLGDALFMKEFADEIQAKLSDGGDLFRFINTVKEHAESDRGISESYIDAFMALTERVMDAVVEVVRDLDEEFERSK